MYYQCSENKIVDQLRSYCTADLCLCFRICRNFCFLMIWFIYMSNQSMRLPIKKKKKKKVLHPMGSWPLSPT